MVSEEADECVGRIVGSSSVEPSTSVSASLAASEADIAEHELVERRNARDGPTWGV